MIIIKTILSSLFTFKTPPIIQYGQAEIDAEMKLLATEINNLKNSLKKVIDKVRIENSTPKKIGQYDLVKLMNSYKQTVDDFSKLTNFIVDSQDNIFDELRTLKKFKKSGILLSKDTNKDT